MQDILSDIRSSYFAEKKLNAEAGRVMIVVKDEYSSRLVEEYLSPLVFNYDTEQYEASNKISDASGTAFHPVMFEKANFFVTNQCDKIRHRLKHSGDHMSSIKSLSIESQMMLLLEEELHSLSDDKDIDSASGSGLRKYFAGGDISESDRCEQAKKKQRTSTTDTTENEQFIGMRCVTFDDRTVNIVEYPGIMCNSNSGKTDGTSVNCGMSIMVLTHSQIHQQINIFEDFRPSSVILFDADLACIRLLEVYTANTTNKIQVSDCYSFKLWPELAHIYLQVFFTVYEASVEERRYESSISREKKAFTNLISYKAHMVIPQDVPGKVKANMIYFISFLIVANRMVNIL